MTTYNTNNPVPSVDVRDLYDNAENLDNFSNAAGDFASDRFGVSRQSLQGIRNASQYQFIGAYAAGLVFTSYNQAFSYSGEFYAPSAGVVLPYTTTGAGAAEVATFRSVGDAVLRGDLSSVAANAGASIISRAGQVVQSISSLRLLLKTSASKHAFVMGYYSQGDGGGGAYWYDSTDTASADNGGTIIVAADAGRWKLASTKAISVKQFGAKGNNTDNDTAKIQAAITYAGALGGAVFFPSGIYIVNSAINIGAAAVALVGESRFGTIIKQIALGDNIFNITGNFCSVSGLSFIYDGVPVTGATAIYVSSSSVTLSDFVIRSCHIGIHYYGVNATAGKISNFEILDYESVGLLAQDMNDLFVSKFIMNAGNALRGALGGIRLVGRVEAFICGDGDILFGVNSMTSDATVYGISTRPAYNNFTNVFFDSAKNSVTLSKMVETDFVGCWFSGGRSGSGSAGCTVGQSDSIRFTNTRFFNCGAQGCVVSSSAVRTSFSNCKFESNSVTAGAAVAHGLQVSSNTTDFQVIGCQASNGLYTGTQGFGIFIDSGCDRFVVRDNNVRGNATGGISDNTVSGADKTIHGNIGYRTSSRGAANILSGTTSIVVAHGLGAVPLVSEILLTRGSGNAGSTDLFPNSVTATQFTINTAAAPSVNMAVNWQVRTRGA
jgi:hypothetical protein